MFHQFQQIFSSKKLQKDWLLWIFLDLIYFNLCRTKRNIALILNLKRWQIQLFIMIYLLFLYLFSLCVYVLTYIYTYISKSTSNVFFLVFSASQVWAPALCTTCSTTNRRSWCFWLDVAQFARPSQRQRKCGTWSW